MKAYIENGINLVELQEIQKRFLLGYAPKDLNMTSRREMRKINDALDLEHIDRSELTPLRNSVILFYRKVKQALGVDYFYSSLSVTAVIDEVIYQGHI